MGPDPEPDHLFVVFHGERAVMQSDACGPESTNLLQLNRRVTRILSQECVAPVGQLLN
jgi:hypothetical protein